MPACTGPKRQRGSSPPRRTFRTRPQTTRCPRLHVHRLYAYAGPLSTMHNRISVSSLLGIRTFEGFASHRFNRMI